MVKIFGLHSIPSVQIGDNIGNLIVNAVRLHNVQIMPHDIFCVASKIVSVSEGRQVSLAEVVPSEQALKIHAQVPRKDARLIQLMLNETRYQDGSRLSITDGFIGGWMPNGMFLTSAGVDKLTSKSAILLPNDSDQSAGIIAQTIKKALGIDVSVIITDSEGRPDKRGATQIAIGLYGLTPVREENNRSHTKTSRAAETLCDLIAASAALEMGQRDAGIPVAVVSGLDYTYNTKARISDAIN
ncbi:MAG TPA: glutamate ligase [Lactobacillus sp.]|nr:glutamate ligase [Lactobacillus sp.]